MIQKERVEVKQKHLQFVRSFFRKQALPRNEHHLHSDDEAVQWMLITVLAFEALHSHPHILIVLTENTF
jgi:hypothetical protein